MSVNQFQAVTDVAEVMKFESWLRFYFVRDEDGVLYLRVSAQARERIAKEYPHLAPLVEEINDKSVTYEQSVNTVCQFVALNLDGARYPLGTVNSVFGSPEFETEMRLFHLWSQAHEEQLDQAFLDFRTWCELFEQWKNSDAVKEHFSEQRAKHAKVLRLDNETTH